MTRDDLFKINAGIVRDLAVAAAKFAPKAFMCVISNPVNSTVPIVAEVFKQFNVYDPKRIFGVTTLDIVRASTFVAELIGGNPNSLRVPVVGGHSGVTILPILSQVSGTEKLSQEQIEKVTYRIQFGGDEVVKAKDGAGSATLSMAFAGARFALNIIEAVAGKTGIVENTYVDLSADKNGASSVKNIIGGEIEYFSVPVELGPGGVKKILPIGDINKYEKELFSAATSELKGNIVKGTLFITEAPKF